VVTWLMEAVKCGHSRPLFFFSCGQGIPLFPLATTTLLPTVTMFFMKIMATLKMLKDILQWGDSLLHTSLSLSLSFSSLAHQHAFPGSPHCHSHSRELIFSLPASLSFITLPPFDLYSVREGERKMGDEVRALASLAQEISFKSHW